MVTKSIPARIIEEFIESLKKSSLFDDEIVKSMKKIMESEKRISRKDIMTVISSGVEK